MAAAAPARRAGEEGGEHGADAAFVFRLRKAMRTAALVPSAMAALAPLAAAAGIDMEMVEFIVETRKPVLGATLAREGVPEYRLDFAVAIYLYTLDDPKFHEVINGAMHAPDRDSGPGGLSELLHACMPFIKFLDTALESLPAKFRFAGKVNTIRGSHCGHRRDDAGDTGSTGI